MAFDFWKENGLRALVVKSKHKLQGIDNDYDKWYELTKPTEEELERQRQEWMDYRPKLSISHSRLPDAGAVFKGAAGFHFQPDL